MKSVYSTIAKWPTAVLLLLLAIIPSLANATSYTWTGAVSSDWEDSGNWSPSSGYPDIGDDVTIVNAGYSPTFYEGTINNFTMSSGSLDLNGFVLLVTGSANFSGGTITSSGGPASVQCANATIFAGTTFSVSVAVNSNVIAFNGGTFNNPVTITKTGTGDVTFNGGNTFKSSFTLSNSGSGEIKLCNVYPDTYQGNVTFVNTGTGWISASHAASGTVYQGNMSFVSTTGSPGIRLGQAGGTSSLSSGQTMGIGGAGFSSGYLSLKNFTQSGSTSQSLTLTGDASLAIESGTTFNGAVTFSSPNFLLNGATFEGAVSFTKTSTGNDQSQGGNTFKQTALFTNTGAGDIILAVSNPDAFQGVATFTNTSSGTINIAYSAAGTTFTQNIVVNSTGSTSKGIRFGQSGGTASLATGKTISVGGTGFSSGRLQLKNFTQVGSTSQTISITTGTASLYLESGTTFNGNVNYRFPQVFLNGATFNGTATIQKGSAGVNTSIGGNTFNSTATITNSGSGPLTLGSGYPDIVNGNAEFKASGSNYIQVAHSSAGTAFNGSLIVNSYGAGLGVRFGQGGGTSVLADGKTISIGGTGFSSGWLMLKGFSQLGTTAQSLVDFTDETALYIEAGSSFEGAITFAAPELYLNGMHCYQQAAFTHTGYLPTSCIGGNTFEKDVILAKSGDGEWILGSLEADVFNGNLMIENSGSDIIYLADGSSGNLFKGDVELNSNGASGGIRFGQNAGTSTLYSGKLLKIGSSGFTSGDLRIANFTQNGSTSQTLNTFGSGVEFYFDGNNTFNGNLTVAAPGVYLQGTTFNGTTSIIKSGSAPNISAGGNVFNAVTTISVTGSGAMYLAGSAGDTFNENVTFLQNSTFTLFPAYNVNSTFAKNISTVGSTSPVMIGGGGGRAILNSSVAQVINGDVANPIEFGNLTINKASNNVTLNVPVIISTNLSLTAGKIVSSSTNLLIIIDNATVSDVSQASYVSGPVRKEGNDAFTFPIGKGGYYRPASISAPATVGTHFVGEFFLDDSDGSYSHDSRDVSLEHLSHCEYWLLNRTSGSSSAVVTLSWNTPSCGVTELGDLRVARWDGTTWRDHGNGGTTGNTSAGLITSDAPVTSFSPFTLGSTTTENPLPVNLVYFEATPNNGKVQLNWTTVSETNNDYFSIESSIDAEKFQEIAKVSGAGNSNTTMRYSSIDATPYSGVSYYRLKQVDFDGKIMYSSIRAVNLPTLWANDMVISPNPTLGNIKINFDPKLFSNVNVELRDLQGRILLKREKWEVHTQSPMEIDLSAYPHGLYFLHATGNGKTCIKRVIKN